MCIMRRHIIYIHVCIYMWPPCMLYVMYKHYASIKARKIISLYVSDIEVMCVNVFKCLYTGITRYASIKNLKGIVIIIGSIDITDIIDVSDIGMLLRTPCRTGGATCRPPNIHRMLASVRRPEIKLLCCLPPPLPFSTVSICMYDVQIYLVFKCASI